MQKVAYYWKESLAQTTALFRRVWEKCPKCGREWKDFRWENDSHDWLIVECASGCLYYADAHDFWLWLHEHDPDFPFCDTEEGRVFPPEVNIFDILGSDSEEGGGEN